MASCLSYEVGFHLFQWHACVVHNGFGCLRCVEWVVLYIWVLFLVNEMIHGSLVSSRKKKRDEKQQQHSPDATMKTYKDISHQVSTCKTFASPAYAASLGCRPHEDRSRPLLLPTCILDLPLKYPDTTLVTYKKRQMKHLKTGIWNICKNNWKHFKTMANIRDIYIKHFQHICKTYATSR